MLCAVLTSHPNKSMYFRTMDCLVVSTLASVGLNFERTGICFLCLMLFIFKNFGIIFLVILENPASRMLVSILIPFATLE